MKYIKVISTFKKPLPRKKAEAIKIHSTTAEHLFNSKAEHHQPAVHRVRMTREIDVPLPLTVLLAMTRFRTELSSKMQKRLTIY